MPRELIECCMNCTPHRETTQDIAAFQQSAEDGCTYCKLIVDAVNTVADCDKARSLYIRSKWDFSGNTYHPEILLDTKDPDQPPYDIADTEVIHLYQSVNEHNISHSLQSAPCNHQAKDLHFPQATNVNRDITLSSSLTRLRAWLNLCEREHRECDADSGSQLPTRTLLISDNRGRDVALIEHEKGTVGRYATLSHCWGGQLAFRTTQQSIDEYKSGIRSNDLPETFRDAVELCAALGVKHLW